MNEIELMQELQNIVDKLENNVDLNDKEYQLISLLIYLLINELVNKAFDLVLSIKKD